MKNRKHDDMSRTSFKDTEQTRLNRITEVYEESIEESTKRKRKGEEKGNVKGGRGRGRVLVKRRCGGVWRREGSN